MGARAAWLVTLPIALAGIETAHAFANALFGSPEGSGELFATRASGTGLVPALAAVGAALVLVGFGCRVAGSAGPASRAARVALRAGLLPVVAFVALELLEGLVHRGAVPRGELGEPTFVVGLLLQLPFAAASWLLATLLLRAGDAVRRLVGRRRETASRPRRPTAVWPPRTARSPHAPVRSTRHGRAPPVVAATD